MKLGSEIKFVIEIQCWHDQANRQIAGRCINTEYIGFPFESQSHIPADFVTEAGACYTISWISRFVTNWQLCSYTITRPYSAQGSMHSLHIIFSSNLNGYWNTSKWQISTHSCVRPLWSIFESIKCRYIL